MFQRPGPASKKRKLANSPSQSLPVPADVTNRSNSICDSVVELDSPSPPTSCGKENAITSSTGTGQLPAEVNHSVTLVSNKRTVLQSVSEQLNSPTMEVVPSIEQEEEMKSMESAENGREDVTEAVNNDVSIITVSMCQAETLFPRIVSTHSLSQDCSMIQNEENQVVDMDIDATCLDIPTKYSNVTVADKERLDAQPELDAEPLLTHQEGGSTGIESSENVAAQSPSPIQDIKDAVQKSNGTSELDEM